MHYGSTAQLQTDPSLSQTSINKINDDIRLCHASRMITSVPHILKITDSNIPTGIYTDGIHWKRYFMATIM
jgi:hypothetical protein